MSDFLHAEGEYDSLSDASTPAPGRRRGCFVLSGVLSIAVCLSVGLYFSLRIGPYAETFPPASRLFAEPDQCGTPDFAKPCLCLFDIDRTLTGKQDALSPTCPGNRRFPGIVDTAYGTISQGVADYLFQWTGVDLGIGHFTLSEVGHSLNSTFCSLRACYVGIVSTGDASGADSAERSELVKHLQRSQGKLPSSTWSGPSRFGEARRACTFADASSTLVCGCLDGTKQEAVKGIVAWLQSTQNATIPPENVWMFDDRAMNVDPFRSTCFNARQVSCYARDTGDRSLGLCGARRDEIVPEAGVLACTG